MMDAHCWGLCGWRHFPGGSTLRGAAQQLCLRRVTNDIAIDVLMMGAATPQQMDPLAAAPKTPASCQFRPSREKLHPWTACRLATTRIVELGPRRERAGAEDRCITTPRVGCKLVEDLAGGGWVSAQQSI